MKRSDYVSHEIQEKVLGIIREHVGKPCPSNDYIQRRLKIGSNHASRALSFLCGRGILERRGDRRRRQYIIVETGETTMVSEPSSPEIPERYAPRSDAAPAEEMAIAPKNLYKDLRPEDLDERGRAYWAFDSSKLWPWRDVERPSFRRTL